MLTITIPGEEFFDESKSEFVTRGDVTFDLEHSLVSLSKWESKWEKPFLGKGERTTEETLDYVRCMVLTPDFDPDNLMRLSQKNMDEINAYIPAKMSATWFNDQNGKAQTSETITSELIYYWMISLNIPWECQYWHLNRLFTLIKVCGAKNAPPKKMSRAEVARRQRELNQKRRAQTGSQG